MFFFRDDQISFIYKSFFYVLFLLYNELVSAVVLRAVAQCSLFYENFCFVLFCFLTKSDSFTRDSLGFILVVSPHE